MAKISKNGNLSGSVNNIVFVESGEYSYVRSKNERVKQSAKTKAVTSVSCGRRYKLFLLLQFVAIRNLLVIRINVMQKTPFLFAKMYFLQLAQIYYLCSVYSCNSNHLNSKFSSSVERSSNSLESTEILS